MATLHEETPWHLPYTAQQLQNAAENQVPIVGDDGCWWRWNIETSTWQNTHIIAKGKDGAGGNQNLLTNWYFPNPINQRGKTSYTGAGYTIDRWKIIKDGSASLTLSGNGITFTKASGSYADFRQTFSAEEFNAIKNQGYVFSALIDGELVRLDSPSTVSSFSGGYLYATENSFFIRLVVNKSISVVAAKLEVGSQQTLARQTASGAWVLNDPAPNKALELVKCQRYYFRLTGDSSAAKNVILTKQEKTYTKFFVPTPVTMRANPAVKVNAGLNLEWSDESSYWSGTGVVGENGVIFTATDCGHGEDGRSSTLWPSYMQFASDYIALDAEL